MSVKTKHICILGFSSEIETFLKKLINSNTNHAVNWVSAKSNLLDGLVINASFLENPKIQNYISLVSCPVVCAYQKIDQSQLNIIGTMPMLDLETLDNADNWLSKLLNDSSIMGHPIRSSIGKKASEIDLHLKDEEEDVFLTSSNQKETENLIKEIGDKVHSLESDNKNPRRQYQNNLEVILNYLNNTDNLVNNLQVACGEKTAWLRASDKMVFINHSRGSIPAIDQLVVLDENAVIPVSARPMKLDLWTFETIWQSELDCDKYIESKQYYNFHRWPQPLSTKGRTDALRLTAFAQKQPVNVKILHKKTDYPVARIKRFLFAAHMANNSVLISEAQAEEKLKELKVTEKNTAENQEKKSFFQRLRLKLGFKV